MKKTIVALLLTLALVGAAVAAPVELKGFLGTEIEYKPNVNLWGATYLQLGLESQLSKNVNGVFGFRLNHCEDSSVNDWYTGDIDWCEELYAYVESNGALWEGAQPVKMTMGSVNINYSPYIAWFGYNTRNFDPDWYYRNINGIAFDNIKLGTINTRTFYVFDRDTNDPNSVNTMGVNFKGAFDDIDLDATFVKMGEPVAYDLTASLSPVKDLALSGHFISDGVADEGWYKFQVAYSGIPNWKLAATYRDFTPTLSDNLYRDTTPSVVDGAFVMPNPYALNQGLEGMILNAATNYAGYDFKGEYDYALRTTAVTAAKDNWSAKLKLFYDRDNNDEFVEEVKSLIVLRGNTTSDVALLKNVKFEGVAEFGEEAVYGGSATYVAPIGLNVVAEYYSDDLADDNGLGWIQNKGLAVRAGYYLNF